MQPRTLQVWLMQTWAKPTWFICTVWLSLPNVGFAQEWTRFRGPNGSGISEVSTVPVRWTSTDFNWVAELPGLGHSSPVIWGNKVFVTSADEEQGQRYVLCLDTANGEVLWRREFPFEKYRRHTNNSSASSSPAVDAQHVYVLWHSPVESTLIALDHAGNEVWRNDLGPYRHGQGGGTSPIVYEELVIVANDHKRDSFLLAVNRSNGKQIWRIPRKGQRACYSTPCVSHRPGLLPEIVFTHCFEGIIGVDPKTGRQQWMIDVFGTHPQRAVGSPIIHDGLIIGSSGARGGEKNVVAVRPPGRTDDVQVAEAYRITRYAPHVPTPIVYGDLLFLWGDSGIVACAQAHTGKLVWQKRVGGNYFGSPVCVNGKLYCVELEGQVVVLEAAERFKLLARNPLGQPSRATPAVSDGVMYLRTYSHLYSIGGGS